ncbi:MAG: integrin alpha [Planctomycetota bacterium JB042]
MPPSALAITLASALLAASAAADPATPYLLRTLQGDADGDRFGARIVRLADLDQDGVEDLLIGAPDALVDGERRGAVHVVSGRTGATLRRHEGAHDGDEFGAALVQSAIDLDGDGRPDYAVGAPGGGYVRVFSGKKGKLLDTYDSGLAGADRFGAALTYTLTPTGGPFGDFAIGAPLDDTFGVDAGSVRLVRGGAVLAVIPGFAANERFGSSLSLHSQTPTGDLLLVGAPGAANHGRTYAIATETQLVQETLVGPTTGTPAGFGSDAATYRVCNTIGIPTCGSFSIVGAPGFNGGQGTTRVYTDDLSTPVATLLGPTADGAFGTASAKIAAGGLAIDLAVGAPGTGGGAGAVHVHSSLDWTETFRIDGPTPGGGFGAALAGGSFDLRPGEELAVGSPDEGAGAVRIYVLAEAVPGPAAVVGDLLAADLGPASEDDVDVATFEAAKGTKLKLRFQSAGDDAASTVHLVAKLKDANGKTRKSWTVKAKGKPVTKKTKLKASGTWTLELAAKKKKDGGEIHVFTEKPSASVDVHELKTQKSTKAVKAKFASIAGATLEFEVDPYENPAPLSIVLVQPDGTPYPDLASFQSDLVFTGIPLLQTGKHVIVVTPSAPGKTEIAGTAVDPPVGVKLLE